MGKKVEEMLFDKRISHRAIAKGLLTKEQLEAHIKSLPDETANMEAQKVFEEDDNVLTFSSVEPVKD